MTKPKMSEAKRAEKKAAIIKTYLGLVKKLKRCPYQLQLQKAGVNPSTIALQFGNLDGLETAARAASPDAFEGMVGKVSFSTARLKATQSTITQHKRFVITTAVSGCKTHEGFAAALKTYCDTHDALLLIMLATDPASHPEKDGVKLDDHIADAHIVVEEVRINRNLFLSDIKLSAKQIDPTTGLMRFGQRSGSFIYASPKQFLNYGATGEGLPHAMMTTGAVTLPDYDPLESGDGECWSKYMSQRTAYIANFDHVLGAIVVEVEDQNRFHFRQIQADKDTGTFNDVGMTYSGEGVTRAACEALILGDWHSGETDPVAASCFVFGDDSVRAALRPKRIVIHDGFNSKSISHHEAKNTVSLARRAASNELSLEAELTGYATDLDRISRLTDEVVIVTSNHDEHLNRYLKEGRFIYDPPNIKIGCKLLMDMIDGADPVRNGVFLAGVLKHPEKVVWLERDQSCNIAGTEIAAHGDMGPNGSKGGMRGLENAYGNCVVAHAHTPGILRSVYRVGTCSLLRLDYNGGPSSWMHTSCALYADGSRQLINVIEGSWRVAPKAVKPAKRKAA